MRQPPAAPLRAAPAGARVERVSPCPVDFYRYLYSEVGRAWHWYERLHWSDDELGAFLARPEVGVWALYLDDQPAGYMELVQHPDRSVEIGYFGLMTFATGKGLGKWFLEWAVARAWKWGDVPERVWLHTCTLDHPAALPNYLKRGFVVTRTEKVKAPTKP